MYIFIQWGKELKTYLITLFPGITVLLTSNSMISSSNLFQDASKTCAMFLSISSTYKQI